MGGHDLRQIENFVMDIKFTLDWYALSDGLPTQDELDIFLLGGTVPPHPIPQPDPNCNDCWGFGKVCPCHGVCAGHSVNWRTSKWNTDVCDCIKKQKRR